MQILKYWFKIVSMHDGRLVKHVYFEMYRKCETGNDVKNWSWHIKNMLFSYGFGHVWVNQGVGDEQAFYKCFYQRLMDTYQQSCMERLNGSSKCILYRNILEMYKVPFYIENIQDIRYRQAITKIRTCNHRLHSETGRWSRPPVPFGQRLCLTCNVLEDEYHFVLICDKYTDLRSKYIKKYYYRRPSMQKFISLITSQNKKQLYNLGIYLYKAFTNL